MQVLEIEPAGPPSFVYRAIRAPGTVCVLDDDPRSRGEIVEMLVAGGYEVMAFGSLRELLDAELPAKPNCLLLDMWLSQRGGLELEAEMAQRGVAIPIVFMAARGDTLVGMNAMSHGATEFLLKPFTAATLLVAVGQALTLDTQTQARKARVSAHREMFDTLTAREREVFKVLVLGHPDEEIAALLGVGQRTVQAYRRRINQKLHTRSVVELLCIADAVGHHSMDETDSG